MPINNWHFDDIRRIMIKIWENRGQFWTFADNYIRINFSDKIDYKKAKCTQAEFSLQFIEFVNKKTG